MDIVKQELQKLLDVNFIYHISDNQWVSPLVVVPKKNGKWIICETYRELNKIMQMDLQTNSSILLPKRNVFLFLNGFSGYNQIQVSPKDQDKTTFTYPWGNFLYRFLPFWLCNTPTTFQGEILSIFSNLINEGIELYMLDFTPYGNVFLSSFT